ncbi:MAG: exosome complex RNA-binding protein Rrp4 [Candidatus Thorarchaeota archaeon]
MAVYFQKREIVVPGQLLADGRYRPSQGSYNEDGKIFSSVIGLAELRGNTVRVVPLQGVYIPNEGDLVLATITYVAGNNWKLDIGGPYGASLHANNALRRPYDEDISRYMDLGDVIAAEVIAFDRNSGPFLTIKGRGLRKLEGGMILEVSPAKIPRIIGKRGSMINMINDLLRIDSMVGQNGRIWIRSEEPHMVHLAIKAFMMIENESHTSRLTDRVQEMLKEELAQFEGNKPETSDIVEDEVPVTEDEPAIEEPVEEVVSSEPESEPTEVADEKGEETKLVEEEKIEDKSEIEEVKEE